MSFFVIFFFFAMTVKLLYKDTKRLTIKIKS
jgi:hypothetical protein